MLAFPTMAADLVDVTDTCILVVSCDNYRDLWMPFFTLFFRYWPDCPYQVYLCSNEIGYDDQRVRTILVGPDRSWSSNLKRCFEHLPTEYCILFQEDFLFTKRVDTEKVRNLVLYLQREGGACLRLMPSPPPETLIDDQLKVGEISKGVAYRVSLQAAIWKNSVLYELLREGESPWEMEDIGSTRSNSLARPFLSISKDDRETWPLDYFSTAVVQGKWVRQAVALCAREGIPVDKTRRAIESRLGTLQRKLLANLREIKRGFLSAGFFD